MKSFILTVLVFSVVVFGVGQVEAGIEKSLSVADANLGDTVTVTIDVNNPDDSNATVTDIIPADLKYIPGTFEVDGNSVIPTVVDSNVSTEITTGMHTITFKTQVVEVQAVDVNVTNLAELYDVNAVLVDSNSAVLTLHPYDGFSKEIVGCKINDVNYTPWDEVPWHTDVHWWIEITVEDVADEVVAMENVVVKDNLGGDLELDAVDGNSVPSAPSKKKKDSAVTVNNVTVERSGKSEKIHLSWDVTAAGGPDLTFTLEVSTDFNPGQGKKDPGVYGYTSLGDHCLNSGAVLKFIDVAGTGFQLSAHTPEICVEAVLPD